MNIRMNTYTLNLEQVQAKLAEVERGFASINRENGELAAQIDEINANKQELRITTRSRRKPFTSWKRRLRSLNRQ